jgi:hypothetical protein
MDVTELRIVIDESDVQFKKHPNPMDVTEL